MSGSDLAVKTPPSIATMRRGAFDPEQVELIRATVAAECNPAELALFLETCVRHDLDPFIKEVWAIRMKRGGPVQTVVSKDGLLKVANRRTGAGWTNKPGEFLGCTSGAVHEHDLYDIDRVAREDGTVAVRVTHKPRDEQGKSVFGGADMRGRGELIGSWAICRRRDHDDVFFECSRKEYDKRQNAWETHPHAMMVKVAEAMVLRKAFPIAGVVGEGEVERVVNLSAPAGPVEGGDEIRWPEDDALRQALEDGFRNLAYRRAKVRMLVNACESEDEYRALLGKLHAEADEAIPEAEVVPE